jgi:lipoate-protein ligase A
MIVKDISFPSAQENIFYDQALLESSEDGESGEALRFWEAEKFFIVLGRTSRLHDDVKIKEAQRDGIEVVRRASGGGTVLQGPGCLNYSLVLSYKRDAALKYIRKSYGFILGNICNALNVSGVNAKFEPISDIVVRGRKFSGNAQMRKRRYILHHGTILYDFPLDIIEKYLKMPKEEPPYRKGRNHGEFLANINLEPRNIKDAIASAFIGMRVLT